MQSRQSVADEPEKQVEEAKLVRKIDLRVILPVCRWNPGFLIVD